MLTHLCFAQSYILNITRKKTFPTLRLFHGINFYQVLLLSYFLEVYFIIVLTKHDSVSIKLNEYSLRKDSGQR